MFGFGRKLESGLSVWIINGRLVRSGFDDDFTEGGHDYVYEFVPRDEIWIDNDLEEVERPYVLLHELHERNLMAKDGHTAKHTKIRASLSIITDTIPMNYIRR